MPLRSKIRSVCFIEWKNAYLCVEIVPYGIIFNAGSVFCFEGAFFVSGN